MVQYGYQSKFQKQKPKWNGSPPLRRLLFHSAHRTVTYIYVFLSGNLSTQSHRVTHCFLTISFCRWCSVFSSNVCHVALRIEIRRADMKRLRLHSVSFSHTCHDKYPWKLSTMHEFFIHNQYQQKIIYSIMLLIFCIPPVMCLT